ncbi:hypothetical protein C8J57DRAFT_1240210 [Mycena rebaudengoi]|nr:hypothetical protein C8J57DRAFT_1240210 [Mycena rebaudengoi]
MASVASFLRYVGEGLQPLRGEEPAGLAVGGWKVEEKPNVIANDAHPNLIRQTMLAAANHTTVTPLQKTSKQIGDCRVQKLRKDRFKFDKVGKGAEKNKLISREFHQIALVCQGRTWPPNELKNVRDAVNACLLIHTCESKTFCTGRMGAKSGRGAGGTGGDGGKWSAGHGQRDGAGISSKETSSGVMAADQEDRLVAAIDHGSDAREAVAEVTAAMVEERGKWIWEMAILVRGGGCVYEQYAMGHFLEKIDWVDAKDFAVPHFPTFCENSRKLRLLHKIRTALCLTFWNGSILLFIEVAASNYSSAGSRSEHVVTTHKQRGRWNITHRYSLLIKVMHKPGFSACSLILKLNHQVSSIRIDRESPSESPSESPQNRRRIATVTAPITRYRNNAGARKYPDMDFVHVFFWSATTDEILAGMAKGHAIVPPNLSWSTRIGREPPVPYRDQVLNQMAA